MKNENNINCNICNDVICKPIISQCGHNFCKGCILNTMFCFTCNIKLTKNDLTENSKFKSYVKEKIFEDLNKNIIPIVNGYCRKDNLNGLTNATYTIPNYKLNSNHLNIYSNKHTTNYIGYMTKHERKLNGLIIEHYADNDNKNFGPVELKNNMSGLNKNILEEILESNASNLVYRKIILNSRDTNSLNSLCSNYDENCKDFNNLHIGKKRNHKEFIQTQNNLIQDKIKQEKNWENSIKISNFDNYKKEKIDYLFENLEKMFNPNDDNVLEKKYLVPESEVLVGIRKLKKISKSPENFVYLNN